MALRIIAILPVIVVAAFIITLSLPNADAAVDYFLKIEGIEGESKSEGHEKEIDVLSWSWGLAQACSPVAGGGGTTCKANFSDASFQKRLDKSSPKLFLAVASGQHIPTAELFGSNVAIKGENEFLIIKMTDVLITSYQIGGSSGGDIPTDSISLNYAKIEFSYRPQKADGTLDSPVKAGWDIAKNTKI